MRPCPRFPSSGAGARRRPARRRPGAGRRRADPVVPGPVPGLVLGVVRVVRGRHVIRRPGARRSSPCRCPSSGSSWLVVGFVEAAENGRVNVPVVASPVPVDAPHACSSASSWSWALSWASSSKSSCFCARFSAESSASRVACTWSSVASRIAWACWTEFCAPGTAVLLTSRASTARCASSWACCCSSVRRAGPSSRVAST